MSASELTFHPTALAVVVGIVGVAIVAVLAVLGWVRSQFDRKTGLLEAFRVLLAIGVAITLVQPEWQEIYKPDQRPVVAILADASGSMATQDVVDPTAVGPAKTRKEWAEAVLARPEWDTLRDRFDLVIEHFDAESEGTDLEGALSRALERHPELRSAVVISDGDWNTGESPVAAATRMRVRGVPVFAIGAGSEVPLPDLEISALDPPTYSVVGKTLQIPFGVASTLPRDHGTTVTLTIGDGTVLTKEVTVPAMGEVREIFTWTPKDLGEVMIQLDVPQAREEAVVENNSREVGVSIRTEALRVLVIESIPRWEYRYLRNALERDPGVEVTCLMFHPGLEKRGGGPGYIKKFPDSPEELSKYDVVFLGDVGVNSSELTVEQCEMLAGLVSEQASGLVFIPGLGGGHFSLLNTELGKLYPVTLDEANPRGFGSTVASQFVLTRSGRRSLLTKLADTERENVAVWRSLPGCQWRSPAIRSKAGTDTLAIHEMSRAPLLVTRTHGTGKILFMGTDGAWRWREGVEDKYHYRFWGQVARWMAYQRHMAAGEMIRLFYEPERPRPRGTVTMNATVLDPTGAPYPDGTVHAEVTDPAGNVEHVRFQVASAEWGLYQARFMPAKAGDYQVRLLCDETAAELETILSVEGENLENIGKPARHSVLREVADVSKGAFVQPEDVPKVAERVLELPEPDPSIRRVQLWASPWWAGTLIALLGVFWTLRKLKGAF